MVTDEGEKVKNMEISEEHFYYFKSIEEEQNKKLKDAFFFQVAKVSNKFTILHIKDYFEKDNRYFVKANIMAEFKTEKEASECMRLARRKIAYDFPMTR